MKKGLQLSLAARNAFVYFILFIIAISFSAWLLISYSYKEVLAITEKRLAHTTEMVHLKFESFFNNVETDINQLAESPLLHRFAINPDSVNLSYLSSEYQSFLATKPNYFQIRLISISDFGNELIKIERQGGKIITTPSDQLQNKGKRDYFQELINLPTNKLYLSKIDLNREFGTLSEPHIPTTRMGKKMKSGELNDFIILINIDLQTLFEELNNTLPQNDHLRIVNQSGHYIFHPNNEKEFTFEFNKSGYYRSEFSLPIQAISDSATIKFSDKAVNWFTKLDYARSGYQLYSILSANKADVLASFYSWRKTVLIASISIGLLFLGIAFLYMRIQVRELKSITQQMTLFSKQLGPKTLPIHRQDEIGELAREFEKMSAIISENHTVIEDAKNHAELAHQEKTEFLENMSHEIRNPLQSILGAIDILKNNQQLPHQQSFIESIQFSSLQLQSLANDILDFNKIRSLEIELEPTWNEIDKFCADIYKSSQYLAKSKQISFSYSNQLKIEGIQAFFDSKRLYQILNNLITNALKFTDKYGAVDFTIIETKNNYFQFIITDTGCGLTEAQQSLIQDRHFAEGKNAGAGLGIPIVQNLLKIHQSALKIESTVNKGSRFSFILNLKTRQAPYINNNQDSIIEKSQAAENLDLLIIEDDPQIIKWYQHTLQSMNLKFLTHPSQLQQVQALTFNHIISDYNFGRSQLDINTLKNELKLKLKTKGKLIIVSGQLLTFEEKWIYALQKPININDLLKLFTVSEIPQANTPNFSSIEKDYDYQPALIHNAISLLINEWEKDRISIWESISAHNLAQFEAIQHRLITSIRRLQLLDFEHLLNETKNLFNSANLSEKQMQINEAFEIYLSEMKKYQASI